MCKDNTTVGGIVMTPLILHIKSYVPYYSVIPPHTGLCPLLQCYSHMNSYAPYCSAKPPEKELFPYCSIILVFYYKAINTACNLFKFTLCPTVRWNNSVSAGITL
jgi:hypothetical protein